MGNLVLLRPRCPNLGSGRTSSTVFMSRFSLYDKFGDNLQTCQTQSAELPSHDWVVHKLGTLLGSVGYKVKIHKITTATGKERRDIEIRDYVVLPRVQTGQPSSSLPSHSGLYEF